MSFSWHSLFLILFLKLRAPQFTLDSSTFSDEEYSDTFHCSLSPVLKYPGGGPLEFSRPDGQIQKLENLLEPTRIWLVNEMDSFDDNTVEKNDFIQKDPQAILQKRLNICLLTDKDICLEVDNTLTGNVSLLHGGELEGDLCLSGTLDFTSFLSLAQQRMRAYSELAFIHFNQVTSYKFITHLLEEWQPGHKFNKMAMVILAAVDVITILAFIWRRVPTVKSRTYQLTKKQLVKRATRLTNEKHDAVMKISHLNKKIEEHESQLTRFQIRVLSTQRKNKELKASLREMKEKYKLLNSEKDSKSAIIKEIEKNQRQNIKQKPESMNQLYPQVETDLLNKMVQEEELGWLDKIAKLTENIHGHIQLTKNIIEETNKDLEKTDKLFENQMQGIEEQYKESLKLVSDQQRENEEHELRWKEEIAEKTKKFMEEVWLKDVISNGTFLMEPFEPSWQSERQNWSQSSDLSQHNVDASRKQGGEHILFSTRTLNAHKKRQN